MSTSATGGYILPAAQPLLPGGLTFTQFLQSVFVGISGLPGIMVRPKWQPSPPKQPSVTTNWLAISVVANRPDANIYTWLNDSGVNVTQRHEDLEVQCSFYGPDAAEYSSGVRDGFSIPQNLEALRSANMGFVNTSQALRVPDLVNEQWVDRFEMSVFLRREILRVYPILSLLTFSGTVTAELSNGTKTIEWNENA